MMDKSALESWLAKISLSQAVKHDFCFWLKDHNYSDNLSDQDYEDLLIFFARKYIQEKMNARRKSPD